MPVYITKDKLGRVVRHLAIDKGSAIRAHLCHFGNFFMNPLPMIIETKPLSEYKTNRSSICWSSSCTLIGFILSPDEQEQ